MALTDNLQGYWDLDEESGTRADSTANGNTLQDANTVLFGTGIIDNAADFEEANDERLTITDAAQTGLDIAGSDMTVSMWVKMESQPPGGNQIMFLQKSPQSGNEGYAITYHDTLGLRFAINNGGNETKRFTKDFTNGTWFHIVCRYTLSSKEFSVWFDGVEQTPQTGTKVGASDNSDDFVIGADATVSAPTMDGLIDEVGIWDSALTDEEIGQLYNDGDGLAYPLVPAAGGSTTPVPTLLTLNVG